MYTNEAHNETLKQTRNKPGVILASVDARAAELERYAYIIN